MINYRAVVFGATSTIASEILRSIAADRPCSLLLIGRDCSKLDDLAADLHARGAQAISNPRRCVLGNRTSRLIALNHGIDFSYKSIAYCYYGPYIKRFSHWISS